MQVIITMRKALAQRFARDRATLDTKVLFAPFPSVQLIGQPGYSMRLSCETAEVDVLKEKLHHDFIVEPDYVMQVLTPPRKSRRPAAATEKRAT